MPDRRMSALMAGLAVCVICAVLWDVFYPPSRSRRAVNTVAAPHPDSVAPSTSPVPRADSVARAVAPPPPPPPPPPGGPPRHLPPPGPAGTPRRPPPRARHTHPHQGGGRGGGAPRHRRGD